MFYVSGDVSGRIKFATEVNFCFMMKKRKTRRIAGRCESERGERERRHRHLVV